MSFQKIVDACGKHWDDHKANCSGFVRAVAGELGVTLAGNADAIVAAIQAAGWSSAKDGAEAASKAEAGNLVIGGLASKDHDPSSQHGHVVVVVPGSLAHGKYPKAYWGSIAGVGKKNETVNWAWNKKDRDKVIYAYRAL